MRLAVFIFAAGFALPAVAQDSFATRSECLQILQRALFSAQLAEGAPGLEERRLAEAPPAAKEHSEAALDAIRRRSQANIDYADAVMLICQSYDQ